jgi:hypothetical protein
MAGGHYAWKATNGPSSFSSSAMHFLKGKGLMWASVLRTLLGTIRRWIATPPDPLSGFNDHLLRDINVSSIDAAQRPKPRMSREGWIVPSDPLR